MARVYGAVANRWTRLVEVVRALTVVHNLDRQHAGLAR